MNIRPIFAAMTLSLLAAACSGTPANQATTHLGEAHPLGEGTVRSYVTVEADGTPSAIGLRYAKGAFEGLPAEPNTISRCFDMNKNGKIDDTGECEGDYETKLVLPPAVADRSDLVIKWIGVNWNPHGHVPEKVYDLPHFDMHFYIADRAAVEGIRTGPCGFFINCEDFERATIAVAARYVHPDHINVDAAVPAMGNHLIDVTSPEFAKPPQPFTHTYIVGAYAGEITFYEPMITHEFLMGRPRQCFPIKQPSGWQKSGYHPTVYCIRYDEGSGDYTVSLEGLVYRQAG